MPDILMLVGPSPVFAAVRRDGQDGFSEVSLADASLSVKDVSTSAQRAISAPGPAGDDGDYEDPQHLPDPNRVRTPSHRHKQIHRFRCNAWAMLKRHPRGRAIFLTLTLEDEGEGKPDSQDAAHRLRSVEPVLDRVFAEWMLVMEFDPKSGVPHFHGLGMARESVSAGWQNQPSQEIRKIRRAARWENRPLNFAETEQIRGWSKCLTPNLNLRDIWNTLRAELPAYGFGRAFPAQAAPLEDATNAIGYCVKDLEQAPGDDGDPEASSPASRYRRGTRLFYHSRNFQSVCSMEFSWNSPKTRLNRLRKSRIAVALRVVPERCKLLFGDHWNFRLDRVIGELNRRNREWVEGTDAEVEAGVMEALATMPPRSNATSGPGEPTVPRWAQDLSSELWERRDRHRRGLPEDYVPDPVSSLMEDMLEAETRRLSLRPGKQGESQS